MTGRLLAAAALAIGGSSALAVAPLSASAFDGSHEGAETPRSANVAMAKGGASDHSIENRMAAVDDDGKAAEVMKEPIGPVDWWAGFRDSTLNLLEQMARDSPRRPAPGASARNGTGVQGDVAVSSVLSTQGSADPGDATASLATAYVHARVLRIRLVTAQALVLTARRQAEHFVKQAGAAGAQESAAAQRAAAMAERAQRVAAGFEVTLDQCVGEIAALTGMDSAQARSVLEPSLSSSQLPAFGVVVPSRLPAQVVRGRADVRAVEVALRRERTRSVGQYQFAQFAAALDGWIEPKGDAASADAAQLDVVARAKAEVAAALYRLIRQQQAAAMSYQMAQVRRLEFEAVLRRQQLGEAADGEVHERHMLLLVETDRLAAAVGAVADSWIALNAATGGLATIAAAGYVMQGQPAGVTP